MSNEYQKKIAGVFPDFGTIPHIHLQYYYNQMRSGLKLHDEAEAIECTEFVVDSDPHIKGQFTSTINGQRYEFTLRPIGDEK